MYSIKQYLSAITLSLTTITAFATPPKQLITHNNTNVESNAYIAGTIPSRHPTKANSENRVAWTEVRLACIGHVTGGTCPALIKMGTGPNDGGNPVTLGMVTVDLNSGNITPSSISGGGYTMIVNGPGETTLIKN